MSWLSKIISGEEDGGTLDNPEKSRAFKKDRGNTFWINPVIDPEDSLGLNKNLTKAIDILKKNQSTLRFDEGSPEYNVRTYADHAGDRNSPYYDTAATTVRKKNFTNIYKPAKSVVGSPNGLATVLAHEMTHSLGDLSNMNHTPGTYFTSTLSRTTNEPDWKKTAKELEAILGSRSKSNATITTKNPPSFFASLLGR